MYNDTFCDNCGCGISNGNAVVHEALPTSHSSPCFWRESAVICKDCDSDLEANYTT